MRTAKEMLAEAQKLREMKKNVRHYTAFGDDNWAAIEAQIEVFESDLDEDDIYDAYDDNQYIMDSALDAYRWGQGEQETAPSEEWETLT